MTLREHLQAAALSSPAALADLVGPPFPDGTQYAWRVFSVLHGTREHGPHGPQPIQPQALRAHLYNTRDRLTPHEVQLVHVADRVFLEEIAARMPERRDPTEA